jgi:hypothetical protein
MIIKKQANPFILLTQEGKFISYLVVRVGVRVALVALLAIGTKRHGAEVVSSEAAQPVQVLGRLLLLRRAPLSSMLLELKVEYAELESTSLAPTITRALPRLSASSIIARPCACSFACSCGHTSTGTPSIYDLDDV